MVRSELCYQFQSDSRATGLEPYDQETLNYFEKDQG